MSYSRHISYARNVFLGLALLAFAATSVLFVSWQMDRNRLQEVAQSVQAQSSGFDETLVNLTAWVYQNQGFAKNQRYFLWKRLDATPIQVLEHGGDCEDKSKLLSTLLRELKIPSTMAMLYHCDGECVPVHTITLARTENGWTPLDAVYNIAFPAEDGGMVPVDTMIANPDVLNARLDQLAVVRGPGDKINRYKRELETYTHLTTLNWDKNGATRTVASVIRSFGGDPRLTARPLFLDDPKQFFSIVGYILTAGLLFIALIIDLFERRFVRRRAATGEVPATVQA